MSGWRADWLVFHLSLLAGYAWLATEADWLPGWLTPLACWRWLRRLTGWLSGSLHGWLASWPPLARWEPPPPAPAQMNVSKKKNSDFLGKLVFIGKNQRFCKINIKKA
jgi:hypothetical protein